MENGDTLKTWRVYTVYTLYTVYTRIYTYIHVDSEQQGNTLKRDSEQLGNTLKGRYAN